MATPQVASSSCARVGACVGALPAVYVGGEYWQQSGAPSPAGALCLVHHSAIAGRYLGWETDACAGQRSSIAQGLSRGQCRVCDGGCHHPAGWGCRRYPEWRGPGLHGAHGDGFAKEGRAMSVYCSRRTAPVVEGPFVRVPCAFVCSTLRGVLEFCHCSRGYGYPWPRQMCRGDGDEGGRRHLGPLPLGVCRRRKHPHDRGTQ